MKKILFAIFLFIVVSVITIFVIPARYLETRSTQRDSRSQYILRFTAAVAAVRAESSVSKIDQQSLVNQVAENLKQRLSDTEHQTIFTSRTAIVFFDSKTEQVILCKLASKTKSGWECGEFKKIGKW